MAASGISALRRVSFPCVETSSSDPSGEGRAGRSRVRRKLPLALMVSEFGRAIAYDRDGARGETVAVVPGVNPLRFRCPISGCEIESDFAADRHTLSMIRLFSVRLRCPTCERPHEFKVVEALADDAADETSEQTPGTVDGSTPARSSRHSGL